MARRLFGIGYREHCPFSRYSSQIFISRHPCQSRSISSTVMLGSSWMDRIKGVFTGKKPDPESTPQATKESLTLFKFADELKRGRTLGSFKNFIVGRSSETTFKEAFKKQEDIIRYLAAFDPTGENIQPSQKQSAAKDLNCTIADVENALAKFTYAKEAMKKLEKLKEEGKPMPKSWTEPRPKSLKLQKLMGSTPLDLARSNLAKSGQLSRNTMCPCGSKKKYKRCCGKTQA